MKLRSKSILSVALCCLPIAFAAASTMPINTNKVSGIDTSNIQNLINNKQGLSPKLLQDGLKAFKWAKAHGQVKKNILTIVNLGKDSKYKRLWVINLNNDTIMAHTLVAQGKNSGLFKGTRFSNRRGSDQSSLGVYVTANRYYGHDGYSLRLKGLEAGINSNAMVRDVVMHPAWYVSESFAHSHGRVGRSWGCFALSKTEAPKVINIVKNGSVIFAYAPQEQSDPILQTTSV